MLVVVVQHVEERLCDAARMFGDVFGFSPERWEMEPPLVGIEWGLQIENNPEMRVSVRGSPSFLGRRKIIG